MKISNKELKILLKKIDVKKEKYHIDLISPFFRGGNYISLETILNLFTKRYGESAIDNIVEIIKDNVEFIEALVNTPECELDFKRLYNYKLIDDVFNTKTSFLEAVDNSLNDYATNLNFNKTTTSFNNTAIDFNGDTQHSIFLPDTGRMVAFETESDSNEFINSYTEILKNKQKENILFNSLEEIEITEGDLKIKVWKRYDG